MSHPAPRSRSAASWLRRHWLVVAVVACATVLVFFGRPAWAADGRVEVNQTVPPPTPMSKPDKDKNNEEQAPPPAAAEQLPAAPTPSVSVQDQTSDGASVLVPSVTAAEDGWMVIHIDQDGGPGTVLGETAVPAGTTGNVIVLLDPVLAATSKLWAMLHVDAGNLGVYEFPGPDAPVKNGDQIVMLPFTASIEPPAVAAAAPPPAAEATEAESAPAPTEAAAETAPAAPAAGEATTEAAAATATEVAAEMAAGAATPEAAATTEAAATAEAAPAETMATEAAAPQQMPATGNDNGSLALAVAVLLVLAGGSLVLARRRAI